MPSPSVRKHFSEIDVTKSLDYNKEHFCVSIHFKTQNCTAHLFHNDFSQMKNNEKQHGQDVQSQITSNNKNTTTL